MNIFDINLDPYKFNGLSLDKSKTDKTVTKNMKKTKAERLIKSLSKEYKLELQYLSEAELQAVELKFQELELLGTPYMDLDVTELSIYPGTGIKSFEFDFDSYKTKQNGPLFELSIKLKITVS